MVEIHPKLRSWVTENIRIGHDLSLLKTKLVEQGQNPAIVDQIVAELATAERVDKFPDYVIQWLKYSESQGDHIDYIKDKLRGHGYSDSDINYLIQKHVVPKRQEHLSQFHSKEKKYNAAQWLVLVLIVVVAVVIALMVFRHQEASPSTSITTGLTSTTLAGATTTTIKTAPLLALKPESGDWYSTTYVKKDNGILLNWNTAFYYKTKLPPGSYRFQVMAKADKGQDIGINIVLNATPPINNTLMTKYRTNSLNNLFFLNIPDIPGYGWPQLIFTTDSKYLGSVQVDSGEWKQFMFNASIDEADPDIWIFYLDDLLIINKNGEKIADRNVYINAIDFAPILP